ncbi:hypothetical protein [Bdellovibrio bacteriovorus]|nr:hypothetical protein [Bdellovibrio bacteriovorus]
MTLPKGESLLRDLSGFDGEGVGISTASSAEAPVSDGLPTGP